MTDCAIVAVASTTATVRALIQRLAKGVMLDDNASAVPWTIVNKYYTADVKFLVHTISSWTAIQGELLAPALLFVWNSGEPYRDYVRKLSQHTSRHDFEVALAVRLPQTNTTTLLAEVEDDQDVDAYLSSKGFEFVDVPDIETCSFDRSGILGLPRIVDALSTIMWPSMVRLASSRATATDFVNPGSSSDDYHNLVRLVGEKISGNGGVRMRRELEALERWLDEDTVSSDADAPSASGDDEAVPWSTVVTPGTLSPSSSGVLEASCHTTPKAGFDDDFTSFVSASPPHSADISHSSTMSVSSPQNPLPLVPTSFGSTFSFDSTSSSGLTPTFGDHGNFGNTPLALNEAYKSLGSVSDFGNQDKDYEQLTDSSDQADEDMPSQAEIAETSLRIFGTVPLPLSPEQERGDGVPDATALGGAPSPRNPIQELDVEMMDADLEPFDLQSVLGALQGLKEEIAGMPDKERRRAAARVALGLAYGLGGNPHPEASEELV